MLRHEEGPGKAEALRRASKAVIRPGFPATAATPDSPETPDAPDSPGSPEKRVSATPKGTGWPGPETALPPGMAGAGPARIAGRPSSSRGTGDKRHNPDCFPGFRRREGRDRTLQGAARESRDFPGVFPSPPKRLCDCLAVSRVRLPG
jgi:hypothetical protein